MLQIDNVLKFSKQEKKYLKWLKKLEGGQFDQHSWDNGRVMTLKIKNKIGINIFQESGKSAGLLMISPLVSKLYLLFFQSNRTKKPRFAKRESI